MVLACARAGTARGIGWTYAAAAAAGVVTGVLAGVVTGRSAMDVPGAAEASPGPRRHRAGRRVVRGRQWRLHRRAGGAGRPAAGRPGGDLVRGARLLAGRG